MSQKSCRIIRKKWKENSELAVYWFEDNYINLNTGECHLLISGHKYEYQWVQIGKDMVWEETKDKLLGIAIDNELILDRHLLNTYLGTNKELSVLCKLKNISAAKDTL